MSDAPKTWPFPKSSSANINQTPIKPVIYMLIEERSIALSAFPCDTPEWDTNHMDIVEPDRPYHTSQANILRNVLEQAGIKVIEE